MMKEEVLLRLMKTAQTCAFLVHLPKVVKLSRLAESDA